jgi:hypothetical protein
METRMLTRRDWLRTSLAGAATALLVRPLSAQVFGAGSAVAAAGPNDLTVYKSASCGCCKKWVEHMSAAGFKVTTHDVEDVNDVKRSLGVPDNLASCHTGILGKYLIEGHVPADVVRKMQKEQPKILGLAVPGMPAGSPGMEGMGKDPYEIVAFERGGKRWSYARR